jgi:hypothetical protein
MARRAVGQRLSARSRPGAARALGQRSTPARRLGALIAVCAGAPLRVEQCRRAVAGWQATRADAQRAFEELLAANNLVTRTSSVTLRQNAFASVLLADLDEPALLQLHVEAAQLLREDPRLWVRGAQHYMRVGRAAQAIQRLVTVAQTDALLQDSAALPRFVQLHELGRDETAVMYISSSWSGAGCSRSRIARAWRMRRSCRASKTAQKIVW